MKKRTIRSSLGVLLVSFSALFLSFSALGVAQEMSTRASGARVTSTVVGDITVHSFVAPT